MKFIDSVIHICPYCDTVDIDTYYNERGYVVYKCRFCEGEHKTNKRITWKTLKGETKQINKMNDNHIKNCLKMVEKMLENIDLTTDGDYENAELRIQQDKIEKYNFWIKLFEIELKDRNEKI